MDRIARLKTLAEYRAIMVAYVKMKMDESDLHGAIDGLMDMRELDTEIKALSEMETK